MIATNARIFVATQWVDFRASFDRLGGFVRERLGADPRSGALYIFFNRSADKVKVLFFDQTGDVILYKRLDQHTFRGIIDLDPEKARIEIDTKKLRDLLIGLPDPKTGNRIH
jgi:transposase